MGSYFAGFHGISVLAWSGRGVRIIGQFERLTMDMSDFVYGEEWTRVREGGGVW